MMFRCVSNTMFSLCDAGETACVVYERQKAHREGWACGVLVSYRRGLDRYGFSCPFMASIMTADITAFPGLRTVSDLITCPLTAILDLMNSQGDLHENVSVAPFPTAIKTV